jgi:1-acyl-sn-glycerol-3-phosphate acyltransferase
VTRARLSRPTPEQLAPLTRNERLMFELGSLLTRPGMEPLGSAWTAAVTGGLIWSCGGRRLHVVGLEHVLGFGKRNSLVVVANHRSFFDFFVISAVLYWRTQVSRRMFYPTRGTFFYDHPLGTAVNVAMSAGRMFPPILREKEKRAFNKYALERCLDELEHPGTVMCIHPEGTRNKGPDPYALLPAQPGAGRLVLSGKPTIPVFVLGMTNSLGKELVHNWTAPEPHRIDVYFGPPIDFSDLLPRVSSLRAQKAAADRCVEAIAALAARQRADAAARPAR